jgi:chemotaxis protein MotB
MSPGCYTASQYYQLEDEYAKSQDELAYLRDTLRNAEEMLTGAQMDQDDVAALRAQLAAADQERKDLLSQFERLRTEQGILEGSGVTFISNAAEGLYGYRAEGDVLFASGSTTLTKAGKAALDIVYQKVKSVDVPVRIDGHTDTDPINKTKDKFPDGNIQLGAQRAIAVRAYLIEKGVKAGRISIASFGEFQPVMSGKDNKTKATNRRVEIMFRMVNTTVGKS